MEETRVGKDAGGCGSVEAMGAWRAWERRGDKFEWSCNSSSKSQLTRQFLVFFKLQLKKKYFMLTLHINIT